MPNYRLDLCYDGSRYRGWQRLPGREDTIQGKLETTLTRILGEEIQVSGSGRTDAGVHARGQVANFHCGSAVDPEQLLRQLRQYLPEDIGVLACSLAPERFHARLSAREKTYCYRIWNSEAPCVFERKYTAAFPQPLDTAAMEKAAACLVGTHDFSAFCGNPRMKKSTVRRISRLELTYSGPLLSISVTGDGFLQGMVRILVGTLLEVGQGRRTPESIPALFGAARAQAGFLAPAQGLCLMEVFY